VQDNAAAKVTVPAVLIVSAAIVLPAGVIVPVLNIVADKAVYVPPVAKVKAFKFRVVVPGIQVLPVKSNRLNQLPVVMVGIDTPDVIDKFGELVIDPPAVVPNVNVLVTDIAAVNPPVPVQVNPVASAIDSTVVSAVVVAKDIIPAPNAIDLVLVLFE